MKAAQMFDMTGRVVIVTGAASGLGLGMAEVMAEHGAIVVMADVNEAGLRDAQARITAAGGQVTAQVLDIADAGEVRAMVDATVAGHGRLDTVFANAGVTSGPGYGSPQGQIENVDLDLFEHSLKINLTGSFATLQAAARHMKTQRSGAIVVTASVAALKTSPLPGHAYHAAKAGLAHLVRLTAAELGPYNVRVNGIAPGPFVTNIAGGRMRDAETAKKFAATVPLGRLAEVEEIKGLALYLGSSASSYVTGAVIPIDGGTAVA
jgi:NAD(P)-dependent dehydrogenase (short-subunit alcohol dehydrogenase family)